MFDKILTKPNNKQNKNKLKYKLFTKIKDFKYKVEMAHVWDLIYVQRWTAIG